MTLGRQIDEKAPNYLKQALGWSYHAPYAGHDGIQLAIGQVFTRKEDFLFPYYRDMLTAISAGLTAEEIILNDDKLDALHKKTFELAQSENWSGTNQQLIDVVLTGRFMERLGDHAVSAARRVVFIVSGFDPSKEPTRDEGTDID